MPYQALDEFANMGQSDTERLYFELIHCCWNKLGRAYVRILSRPSETEENLSLEFIKARTPLPLIVGLGNVDLVRMMISDGVDTNVPATGNFRALHMACYKGHLKMAEVLLQGKADPNAIDSFGRSPLMSLFHAINEKYFIVDLDECYKMTRLLVSHGAKLGPIDMETLILAIIYANVNTVKLLVDKANGDLKYRSKFVIEGDTCLHFAVIAKQPGVWEYVLEASMRLTMDPDKPQPREAFAGRRPHITRYYIDKKSYRGINSFNSSCETPLMKACHSYVQNHKAAKMLLKSGAKFFNSFHRLIEGKRNPELATLYYDLGFDVLNCENKSLLYKAVLRDSPWTEDIVAEIARRKMMGSPIVDKNQIVFQQNEKASYFLELCEAQLREMQKMIFYEKVSFWDVLSADQTKITEYAGNSELVEAFFKAKCKGLFPNYCARIRRRFVDIVPRNTLMDLSAYLVSKMIKRPRMYEIMQHELMIYLDADDFLKLLACCLEAHF